MLYILLSRSRFILEFGRQFLFLLLISTLNIQTTILPRAVMEVSTKGSVSFLVLNFEVLTPIAAKKHNHKNPIHKPGSFLHLYLLKIYVCVKILQTAHQPSHPRDQPSLRHPCTRPTSSLHPSPAGFKTPPLYPLAWLMSAAPRW